MQFVIVKSIVAFVLVSLLLPAAVSAQDDEVVVRVGLHAAEKNLNPFIAPQALPVTHDFTMLVYDTLFWSQSRLDPEPWLATGAEPSEDYRTWTVTVRDDVTWHDGVAFSAHDVAFTFEYFRDDNGPGRYGHHIYDHPVFKSATVINDTTVELTFVDPIATFELLPGGDVPILPRHIWENIANPRADATSLPVGTGPFKMVEYDPAVSYRLEANDDYFLGAPLVDTLIMAVVTDAQAAFAGLRTGELDFVTRNVPAPLVPQMADDEEISLIEGSRFQSLYLMFNTRKPVLKDPAVRKAMSMALDLQTIVNTVEGGLGAPGNDTWTHPQSPWAHRVGGHTFDLDAAKALLDENGYVVGDDGTRIAGDGTPLRWTLLVNAGAPPQIRSGTLVAEQLASLGIDVKVEPLDPAAITAARRPSPDGAPTVEMFIAVFESHAHVDPDHLYFFFHTPGRGVGGIFSGYTNNEFDAILTDALDEPVETKLPLVHQAQEIFAAETPAVTLYYPEGRWAYRPAAYDGWVSDPGHGVFTKRSFLAPYARFGDAENMPGTSTQPTDDPGEATDNPDNPADDPAETTDNPADPADDPAETTDNPGEAMSDGDSDADEGAVGSGSDVGTDIDEESDSGGGTALVIGLAIATAAVTGWGVALRRKDADIGADIVKD